MQNEAMCNRCGDCCRQFTIRLDAESTDGKGWPLFYYRLHKDIDAQVVHDDNGIGIVIQVRRKCSMLIEHDNGATECKIYDKRPQVCMEWPINGIRQNSDMPRCTLVAPRDEQLDMLDADMYTYQATIPLFEGIYMNIDSIKDGDMWDPWPGKADIISDKK